MSSINPNNINGQYPVAGQDNDSQGFRDNFTNIKNNFTFAKSEIEDLQSKVIVTAALDGLTLNNDLENTLLKGAQLLRSSETVKSLGNSGTGLTVNWNDGHFQYFTLDGGNPTLNFTNFPAGELYTKVKLEITVPPSFIYDTVTLSGAGIEWVGIDNVHGGVAPNTIIFTQAGKYVYEFSRYTDNKIYVEEVAAGILKPPPAQYLIQVLLPNVNTSTTFTITDVNKHYYSNTNVNTTVVIPSHDAVSFQIGSQIHVFNRSANVITVDRALYPKNIATNVSVTANTITGNILSISTVSDTQLQLLANLYAGATGDGIFVGANTAFSTTAVVTSVNVVARTVTMSSANTATISNTAISFGNLSTVALYMAGNATVQDRTIGAYGVATLTKVENNTWFINGTGVS